MSVRVLREYERAVVFRLGRLITLKGPGLVILVPAIDRMERVSLRTVTLKIPVQEVITRDNVPVKVTAVTYFRVVDADRSIVEVEDFLAATSQIAQTTLRSILGKAELDSLLSERERLNEDLQKVIDQQTEPWGVKVTTVEIKDVEIPANMQRAIARQAEAERERRAKIINADAEFQASAKLAEAAEVISRNPTTLQLRYLQTLHEIGSENNSTVVFPLPLDLVRPFIGGGVAATPATQEPARFAWNAKTFGMDSRDAWQLDGEGLKGEVLDLVRVRHELQSRLVLLIVEVFSREVLGGKGFRAIAQWLHGSTNLEIGECSLLVGLARLLMLEPFVGDAFHRGDVDALKARQVASFCRHPPKNMTLADVDKARGILLGLASKNIADCDAVRAAIRRIEKQYGKREDGVPVGEHSERNEFYASKGLYGRVSVKGDLDAVNGARLITLLSSLSAATPEKDGVKDARTPALRRADGFCELLRRYERAGLGPIEGGVKPHITVTASAKDMTDLKALKDML
eukprot:gene20338-24400_t